MLRCHCPPRWGSTLSIWRLALLSLLLIFFSSPNKRGSGGVGRFIFVDAQLSDFCYRDKYRRGIGRIPEACPPGYEKRLALCYKECPPHFERGPLTPRVCRSVCPPGFSDKALRCVKDERFYSRSGFGRKRGDGVGRKADRRKRGRCEARHGSGKCEKRGTKYYPKCRAGYENFGIIGRCRTKRIDCGKYGMEPGALRNSCLKVKIRNKSKRGVCADDEEQRGLLGRCFKKCDSGYRGNGPTCRADPPPGWTKCGLGAVDPESTSCASVIFDKVESIGMAALNIGTLGLSKPLDAAVDAGKLVGMKNDLKKMISGIQDFKKSNPGAFDVLEARQIQSLCQDFLALSGAAAAASNQASRDMAANFLEEYACGSSFEDLVPTAELHSPDVWLQIIQEGIAELTILDDFLGQDLDSLSDEEMLEFLEDASEHLADLDVEVPDIEWHDITRFSLQLANLFDPTGITGVVAAFTYPKCNELFG